MLCAQLHVALLVVLSPNLPCIHMCRALSHFASTPHTQVLISVHVSDHLTCTFAGPCRTLLPKLKIWCTRWLRGHSSLTVLMAEIGVTTLVLSESGACILHLMCYLLMYMNTYTRLMYMDTYTRLMYMNTYTRLMYMNTYTRLMYINTYTRLMYALAKVSL